MYSIPSFSCLSDKYLNRFPAFIRQYLFSGTQNLFGQWGAKYEITYQILLENSFTDIKPAAQLLPSADVLQLAEPRPPIFPAADPHQFQCGDCGKILSCQSHLDIHSRSHTGVRPYVCPYCHKGFTVKCNMERHMVTHLRQRPT